MRKRLLIIIISVLVAAAALVVVIYRDAIFSKSSPQTEVSASDEANDAITDEENPAFCEPSETMTGEPLDKVLGDGETAPYSENILEMSLSKDSIPPIENPIYTTIEEADLLFEDYDRMFVYEAAEGVYVYPQRIMVWHEIVNETIDGQLVSVTYCPLTSSVIAYTGADGIHDDNTYGTSGNLLNSNLVMYDRNTDSRIPQILGIGVTGELNGFELNTLP
ncbi:MAG: DUF3179 domain-containing protein, partial [Clostridia bacterium]|nr:DUF3179 domain-containing protein [Clostridia bacterium]MBT7123217.1 DUF3179 domain-containing protein [Clostridia bacterium]